MESIEKVDSNLKNAESDLSRRQKDEKQAYRELTQIRQAREQGELKRKRVQQQFIKSLENGGW